MSCPLNVGPIINECGQFINESGRLPLLKNLPIGYENVQRVKVRHKKISNSREEMFNRAFNCKLSERSVVANGPTSFKPILNEQVSLFDIFYVFPVDGFKFMYNPAVTDSSNMNTIANSEMMEEVFRLGYTSKNLYEGIESGAEIILYDTPRYYCVRSRSIGYGDLMDFVTTN